MTFTKIRKHDREQKPHAPSQHAPAQFADKRSSATQQLQLQSVMRNSKLAHNRALHQAENKGVAQLAVGNAGLQNIRDAIHAGATPAGGTIAAELYAVDAPHDGDFTVDTQTKIKDSALAKGYTDEAATRLSANNPYQIADLAGKTRFVPEGDREHPRQVETFDFYSVNNDPDTVSKHQLNFENIYSATGKTKFKFNARNAALANFFASDVVNAQLAFIHSQPGLAGTSKVKVVERENVVSLNGAQWRARHPGWGVMAPDALTDFLQNTDNGKSTVNSFRGAYTVVSAEVVPYKGGPRWSVKLRMQPV